MEEKRDKNPSDKEAIEEFRKAYKKTKEQLIFIYNNTESQILFAPIEQMANPQYDKKTQELFSLGADGYTISNKYAFFWNVY